MSDQNEVARRVVDAMRAAGQAAEEAVAAAYERGLRRGLAIAREHEGYATGTPCYTDDPTVDWEAAEEALQREVYAAAMGEIEEAKR